MTQADAGASFVGKETEKVLVTLDTAAALTNFSPAYIERLCRDGYVPCAGGKDGELFPDLSELLKVLNITLPPETVIAHVPAEDITIASLSREQLLEKHVKTPASVVGNQPIGLSLGDVASKPLRRGALSFDLVSDEDEAAPLPAKADTGAAPLPPPPPPPPKRTPVIETPPAPCPKPLPLHWPVKTSSDVSVHIDDAPLMPPLAAKPAPVASPAPIVLAPPPEMHPTPSSRPLPEIRPAHDLAIPLEHDIEVLPTEALNTPAPSDIEEGHSEALMQEEDHALLEESPQELAEEPEHALLQPESDEVVMSPDHNSAQTTAEAIDVGIVEEAFSDEAKPEVIAPSVEQLSTAADASWYTLHEEPGSEVVLPTAEEGLQEEPLVEHVQPPVVHFNPTPPVVEQGIAARILDEGMHSQISVSPIPEEVIREEVSMPEPVVAVPHYAVAQLTPSAHPLALPPRVVPFATMVPAAYPQVAAVFTQPHARASEWLPWMRTSHFSKTAVQIATNPEVHPSYPRYSKPVEQEVSVRSAQPVRASSVAESPQKVFVSVVRKPVAPTAVPVEVHVPRSPVDTVKNVIPQAEDAWVEMLAPPEIRVPQVTEPYVEVPQKSREELLQEVSSDIKDSWDAAFLAGLPAA